MRNVYLSRTLILTSASILAGITLMLIAPSWNKGKAPLLTKIIGIKQGQNIEKSATLAAAKKIKKFASLEDLKRFFLEHGSNGNGGIMYKAMPMALGQVAAPVAGNPSTDASSGQSVTSSQGEIQPSSDYSQTNIQVQGVDEADIVKNDGTYIYSVSGNSVNIVSAYPAEDAKVVATIDLKSQAQGLYLTGDYIAVYGQDNQIYQTDSIRTMPIQPSGFTFFKVYNIQDHANPKLVRDLSIEGYYLSSRLVGDYSYLVTVKRSYNDPMPLPRIMQGGTFLPAAGEPGFVMPPVYYFDFPYDSTNLTTVTSINLSDAQKTIKNQSYVLDDSQQMYVSPDNIYLTYTKYLNQQEVEVDVMKSLLLPRLSQDQKKMISDIEAAPNYILGQYEKASKISAIIGKYVTGLSQDDQQTFQDQFQKALKARYETLRNELEKTIIQKIAIKNGDISFQSAGEVPGYLLNQFAMDEADGYFRIATTRSQTWIPYADNESQKSYSNLYVLDSTMNKVGSIENLEPGEKIFAVRFMQGRAYLVTYRQIDPLFVIDLTNPRKPSILGQLKIPGYSTYLHPYDDTTLIGLGRETYEDSPGHVVNKGLKISVFDVSDVTQPKETALLTFGSESTDSIALNDHHAFLFSKEKNLLVIPVTDYNYAVFEKQMMVPSREIMPSRPPAVTSGAYVFSLMKDSIKLRGVIDHSTDTMNNSQLYYGMYWQVGVQRSLYIKDILYTISQVQIKANKLENLAAVKTVALPQSQIPEPIPYGPDVLPPTRTCVGDECMME